MALSLGIVGLPNVGKSLLFNALTESGVDTHNYPFTTIDPNVGVVPVPDLRLKQIAEAAGSKEAVPSTIEFIDIAGLVKGANKGEGLGNQFLANIREVDALIHVLRAFSSKEIVHVEGTPDPVRDFDIVETELILKDLETVERHVEKAHKEARIGIKEAKTQEQVLMKIRETLMQGEPLRVLGTRSMSDEERGALRQETSALHLLTAKPMLVLLNTSHDEMNSFEKKKKEEILTMKMDVKEELDARGLSRGEREEIGLSLQSALDALVYASFTLLDLVTFFTANENEAHAWTVTKGTKAPYAAGKVHSDFMTNFIRADTIFWEKFVKAGGWKTAREQGLVRSEGKDYVVQDGDVMEIRHGA